MVHFGEEKLMNGVFRPAEIEMTLHYLWNFSASSLRQMIKLHE